MIGSKNEKISALFKIMDQELSGAISNISEGKVDDARGKLEYTKKIVAKLKKLDSSIDKAAKKELKEFDEHIKKVKAS